MEQLTAEPLVSIITPNYNGEKFLPATAKSVFAQNYSNWEWIIVDDNSKDASRELIKSYDDARIHLIPLKQNHGPAYARTLAMQEAKGEYLAFLDADDLWLPEKLSTQVEFMQDRNAKFSCHAYRRISEDGHELGQLLVPPVEAGYQDVLKNHSIGTLSVMLHASLKPLVMEKGLVEDLAFWLKILREKRIKVLGLQEDLARYRVVKKSRSSNKAAIAMSVWGTYSQCPDLNFLQVAYYFGHYVTHSLKKYKNF